MSSFTVRKHWYMGRGQITLPRIGEAVKMAALFVYVRRTYIFIIAGVLCRTFLEVHGTR